MASKTFTHQNLGQITVYKRKGSRRVSMRVQGAHVRITQPFWLPYAQGIRFAEKNHQWIVSQRQLTHPVVQNGRAIGKHHHVRYVYADKLATRVHQDTITITVPFGVPYDHETVQARVRAAIKTALTKEAKAALPERLDHIARTYGFHYRAVNIKSMRSRWGSCTSQGMISLNCYLMQAPWDLIDYVLLHELVHTEHLHHGPAFWAAIEERMPDFRTRRKQIRERQHELMAYR